MKYIKKFNTEEEVVVYDKYNLVLVADTDTVLYDVPAVGVWIQHIDGSLYSTDEWTANGFANDDANGVAVVDEATKFVIAKRYIDINEYWSDSGLGAIEGLSIVEDESSAKMDFAGQANTAIIMEYVTNGAVYECANYIFPNGAKGYMPSLGEWAIVHKYKAEVAEAISAVGGSLDFDTETKWRYWSSTQGPTGDSAWYYCWSNSSFGSKRKSGIFQDVPGARFIFCAFTTL